MEKEILDELTRPLKLLKPVIGCVEGLMPNLTQSWLYRRAAITHIRHCVAMTGSPHGFWGADKYPVEVDLNKLWHDEDYDEIKEVGCKGFDDREPLQEPCRVWGAIRYTSEWWQHNKEQATPGVYEKIMELLESGDKLVRQLMKEPKVAIHIRANAFEEEEMDAVEMLRFKELDEAKIGYYMNFSPIALMVAKLNQWGVKILSSAYHTEFTELIRNADTPDELRVSGPVFRFRFRCKDKHVTYPLYFTQAGATHS